MLILSRRANERILFPALGIAVEVASIGKNVVRLGFEAPSDVSIVREEIASEAAKQNAHEPAAARHRLRNRLHTANLAVHVAQKQLQAGLSNDAECTLNAALVELAVLDRELAEAKSNAARPQREIRALVVDDNSNESALLAEFLRLHGIAVATANDGHDALDYLQSHDRPDVVLLDMRMPRCDGPATIAAIRRNARFDGLKVFAVSGADPQECAVPRDARGVDGWFTKPVNPTKLIDQLNLTFSRN